MSAIAELVALLAPPACLVCGAGVPAAARLCDLCVEELPWLAPGCPRCALPSHRPGGCPAAGAAFDSAAAPMAYLGPARALVGALKFRGALPVAAMMAEQVAAALDLRGEAIVAVPPAPRRRRRRGFDPAGALAAELSERVGLPLAAALRRGNAPRQVGTDRGSRRDGSRLAVSATGPAPAQVLLVDDVHTTGTTLDACARALRAAGAERIEAVTYARTL